MYAKIENNVVVEYPLTENEIKSRDPERLFTTDFSSCLPEGYVQVLASTSPATNLIVATETTPTFVDGSWVQSWTQADKYTAQELAQQEQTREESKWKVMRSMRDSAIAESTWVLERHKEEKEQGRATSITDTDYLNWLIYRQQLRDFPQTVTDINNYTLPTLPSAS
jgi:hypothetical protein